MDGPYWFIVCYGMYSRAEDAREAFNAFAEAGLPVLLFEDVLYSGISCVAVYGSDDAILAVRIPSSDDSYAGQLRVFELIKTGVLKDAANFATRDIDTILAEIRLMPDY